MFVTINLWDSHLPPWALYSSNFIHCPGSCLTNASKLEFLILATALCFNFTLFLGESNLVNHECQSLPTKWPDKYLRLAWLVLPPIYHLQWSLCIYSVCSCTQPHIVIYQDTFYHTITHVAAGCVMGSCNAPAHDLWQQETCMLW